jgi:mannose-6-phosphate isomerase-like protein (cupin superfamily)
MAEGRPISLAEKLALLTERWSPRTVDTVDGYDVKIVKILGDFVWHSHADADEMFLVLKGAFRMDFRDRQIAVSEGKMIVVPRGVEHKPFAAEECEILLFERQGLVNTGDAPPSERTRAVAERI